MMLSRMLSALLWLALLSPTALAAPRPLTPREIYKTYGKGVVLVFATDGSAQGSAGTGSIITKDGQVITNAHVVAKDGRPYRRLFIYLKPDKLRGSMKDDLRHRYKATLVDLNVDLDVALLRMVNPPADLTHISFVDPDDVEIGEPVVAIGHPETGGLWTLTTGSISSVVADFHRVKGKDVFQTETSVNRGNSGGPLLNAYGHMVGINTSISRRAQDGLAITDINFSLKSSVAVDWLAKRRLMNIAYVKPDYVPEMLLARLGRAPPDPATVAPSKSTAGTDRDRATGYKVDAGDGKTMVVVVEPPADQAVADDPEFDAATGRARLAARDAKAKAKAKGSADDKVERVQPKQLTKPRPYGLDDFVRARIEEMRALETMMDEMSDRIRERSGRGRNEIRDRSKGMGLW